MGNCWNSTIPEEDNTSNLNIVGKDARKTRKIVEFGREELKLEELLSSLRTGLVFAPTEFSVLPGGLNTTAKVTFSVGNSELQRKQEANFLKENYPKREDSDEDSAVVEPFKLKVTLEGHGWVKGLVMTLALQPVLGAFARRNLQFQWRDNILEVVGCEPGEMEAHSLPLSIETEVEFCQCCLQLTYQSRSRHTRELIDEDSDLNPPSSHETNSIPSLKYSAYKVAIANLDRVSHCLHTIPAKLHHIFFGIQDPVDISVTLWPKSYSTDATLSLKVKSGIVFGEFVYLMKEHLKSNDILKLYNNHRPVDLSETVSSNFTHLDCFVIAQEKDSTTESVDESSASFDAEVELVVSLVGKQIQSIKADLEMSMKEFDALVRKHFNLKSDSFLIILSEDDFAPQYMADDNWKCTYTFSIPDNSFGAGLRRSFRRLSMRRRGNGERPHTPSSNSNPLESLMGEVIELLSSNKRQFPRSVDKSGLSIEELYKSMPLYSMSIEQCGIHPYSIIQVFEVTGPSIPITVRSLSDYTNKENDQQQQGKHAPRTRLANIMDINPDWSITTFHQYIDAVVSLSTSSRQKQLWLKDNSMDDKDDNSSLTLGALLDSWKPSWWAEKGQSRRQLTTKDIDPSEYLVVEKF